MPNLRLNAVPCRTSVFPRFGTLNPLKINMMRLDCRTCRTFLVNTHMRARARAPAHRRTIASQTGTAGSAGSADRRFGGVGFVEPINLAGASSSAVGHPERRENQLAGKPHLPGWDRAGSLRASALPASSVAGSALNADGRAAAIAQQIAGDVAGERAKLRKP